MATEKVNINSWSPQEITKFLDGKVATFFAANAISNIIVENPYFIDLVKALVSLNPQKLDYAPPCRQTLMYSTIPTVLSVYEKTKESLFQDTKSVIILDGWKNANNNSKLLVFSLRNKHANQIHLCYKDTSQEPQDGDHCSDHIVDAVKLAENKYRTTVFAVNTDNDATMKAAVRKSNNKLQHENTKSKNLWETTCYSHSGNLLLGSVVSADFQSRLREIVNAFSSPRMCSLLQRFGGCKQKNYPDTRFCYIRLTCTCVLKSWNAMTLIIEQSTEVVSANVQELILSDDFHREVLRTVSLITPICKLINFCQDPQTNVADGTEKWLSLRLNNDEHEEEIANRIVEAIWPVGYAAHMMHPKYKGDRLDDDQRHVAIQFLTDVLNDEGRQELTSYLERRENLPDKYKNLFNDPYSYWSYLEFDYPNLAEVIKNLMLIPASTASLESYFSIWTFVHNKYRNRLSNENSAQLVDLNYLSKHLDGDIWLNLPENQKRAYLEVEEDYY